MQERLVINKGKTPVWPPILPASCFNAILLTGRLGTLAYHEVPADIDWDEVEKVAIEGHNLTGVCHPICFYENPNVFLTLVPEGATHLNRVNELWYREGVNCWERCAVSTWVKSDLSEAERDDLLIDIRLQAPTLPEGTTHALDNTFLRKTGETWSQWSAKDGSWGETTQGYDWLDLHAKPLAVIGTALHDVVNHPKHYQLVPGVEVYDIRQALAAKATQAGATLDQFSDYDRAIEYLLRMWEKNGLEDARKAAWYLNKLVEKLSDGK